MMTQVLTYRYRIYPTEKQGEEILRIMEISRRFYNAILDEKTAAFRESGKWKRKLAILQDIDAYAQKNNVDPSVLHFAQGEFEAAFRNFLRISNTKTDQYKESAAGRAALYKNIELTDADLKGFPNKKPLGSARKTYSVALNKVFWQDNAVMLPQVGWVLAKFHRFPPQNARLYRCTVLYKTTGKFYLLLQVKVNVADKRPNQVPEEALGVVFYPGHLAIRSDGVPVPVRHTDPELQKQIDKAYQTLKRRQPGSKRYEEQRQKLARLCDKQACRRRDALHKAAREIVDTGKYIGVQVPAVKKMAKYHKADDLQKTVQDEAWYLFYSMLLYKANLNGMPAYPIPRVYPIWKVCAACGKELSQTPRTKAWLCPQCGTLCGKGGNAARNIQYFIEKEIEGWKALSLKSD